MLRSIAATAVVAFAAAAAPAGAATFTVTSPLDNNAAGTLRWAIVKANTMAGADAIKFALPAAGSHTLTPIANLPAVTDPVTIDAGAKVAITLDAVNTTRALALATNDSVVRALHVVESSGAGTADGIRIGGDRNRVEDSYIGTDRAGATWGNWNLAVGVAIAGDGNVVEGSVISEIDGNGLTVAGDENRLEGSRVGLDLAPGSQLGNHDYGVKLTGDRNVIGGARNLIGDNGVDGVRLDGDENVVEGSHVGLEAGNVGDGVSVHGDANVVGPANVISGNDDGVVVDSGSDDNRVTGNLIGTDAAGTAEAGNRTGVHLYRARTGTVEDNVISGNDFDGVLLDSADGNALTGNAIGTDASRTLDIGNGGSGVDVEWSNANSVGTASGPTNAIAYNDDDGVTVAGTIGTRNAILRNSIHSNGDIGIDLDDDGRTPSDGAPDADNGVNDLQNHPVILDFSPDAIEWTLDSEPSKTYRVEFFSGPHCGNARTYLGAVNADTGLDGHDAGVAVPITAPGVHVTATATQINSFFRLEAVEIPPFLSTSELSPC